MAEKIYETLYLRYRLSEGAAYEYEIESKVGFKVQPVVSARNNYNCEDTHHRSTCLLAYTHDD